MGVLLTKYSSGHSDIINSLTELLCSLTLYPEYFSREIIYNFTNPPQCQYLWSQLLMLLYLFNIVDIGISMSSVRYIHQVSGF